MKKFISLCFVAVFSLVVCAQNKDVTTFLGIPVDGTKSEMKQKLIAKGFTPKKVGDSQFFEGEFNGRKVDVRIVTNNNKVYRIMVCDAIVCDEAQIKIRFNSLVHQFENNERYIAAGDFTLSDEEDISYGMNVKNKAYQAGFCQGLNAESFRAIDAKVLDELSAKYTNEQLSNPTESINKEKEDLRYKYAKDLILKKSVWFTIGKGVEYGKYFIVMYYDNEYNMANGEDL